DDAAIVVVPQYQGRVMTATARGDKGVSSGWINYDLVKQGVVSDAQAKGSLDEHMYAFGGEERFWMGPEGGQYSIFFAPKAKFEFDDWFTPDPIDNQPWKVKASSETSVDLVHSFELQNHSGTRFSVRVDRKVDLLDNAVAGKLLGAALPAGVDAVTYRSTNKVTNSGNAAWEKKTGLLSIWMLCMFQPSPTTTVFVPYKQGDESELGRVVADDYFGKVSSDRLKVTDGVVYFKCDGKQRGKIGFSPERATGIAGSYDPAIGRLTLLVYRQPQSHSGYVNSKWELQDKPYQGDAINSYNDGPVDDSGEQMGPFYELESSSPALTLGPGESDSHTQTVLHLYGERSDLQRVLSGVCDVKLDDVANAFE
ncbi:MAG: DUF6786 family protein, partial [Planctomycetota bacterium]